MCSKCKTEKDVEAFSIARASKDGRNYWCRDCCSKNYKKWAPNRDLEKKKAGWKAWYDADPERAKRKTLESYYRHHTERRNQQVESRLMSRYGITLDQYNEMLEAQDGVCAICKKMCTTGQRLAVDHDHETGEVRALLCKGCNFKVGQIEKDWERTKAVLEYLNLAAKQ